MPIGKRPLTFDGHIITGDESSYPEARYLATFAVDADEIFSGTTTYSERPGASPVYVRSNPNAIPLALNISILGVLSLTEQERQERWEELETWFSLEGGLRWLRAETYSGAFERILCSVEKVQAARAGQQFAILLSAPDPWEEDLTDLEAAVGPFNITTTGDTFEIDNPGTRPADLTLDFVPTSLKSSAVSFPLRNRVTLAHRSELKEFADTFCPDGAPIDISEGVISSPDDSYHVLRMQREQNRWVDGDKIWMNAIMPPNTPELMTLGADISDSDSTITAGNPAGFAGLQEGPSAIAMGTERIIYTEKAADGRTLTGCIRGCANTVPAAHFTEDPLYQIPEALMYLDVLSGIDTPPDPLADDDRMPVIDLSDSTNAQWQWSGQLYVPNSHRSGMWVPQGANADDGVTSAQHIRIDPSGDDAGFIFEDLLPSAGRPRFNNLIKDFPCGIKAGAGVFTLDFDIGATLLLQVFATDIEGNESRLITQFWSNGLQTGQPYDSADVLKRLRLNGRIGTILGYLDQTGDLYLSYTPDAVGQPFQSKIVSTTVQTLYLTNDLGIIFELQKDTTIMGVGVILKKVGAETTDYIPDIYSLIQDHLPLPHHIILSFPSISHNDLDTSYRTMVSLLEEDFAATLAAGKYLFTLRRNPNPSVYQGFPILGSSLVKRVPTIEEYGITLGLNSAPGYFPGNLGFILAYMEPQEPFIFNEQANEQTPCFFLLSRDAEPQSDAPLQTGNQIAISNPIVLFDDDTPRTPLVICAGIESCYLFGTLTDGATLTNTTTGEWIKFRFASALGAGFRVNLNTHEISDLENGYPIPHIVVGQSNPNQWPLPAAGANTYSWEDEGVGSGDGELTISGVMRGRSN